MFDVVRAIVPKSDLDDVFLTKEEVRTGSGRTHQQASLSAAWSLPFMTFGCLLQLEMFVVLL